MPPSTFRTWTQGCERRGRGRRPVRALHSSPTSPLVARRTPQFRSSDSPRPCFWPLCARRRCPCSKIRLRTGTCARQLGVCLCTSLETPARRRCATAVGCVRGSELDSDARRALIVLRDGQMSFARSLRTTSVGSSTRRTGCANRLQLPGYEVAHVDRRPSGSQLWTAVLPGVPEPASGRAVSSGQASRSAMSRMTSIFRSMWSLRWQIGRAARGMSPRHLLVSLDRSVRHEEGCTFKPCGARRSRRNDPGPVRRRVERRSRCPMDRGRQPGTGAVLIVRAAESHTTHLEQQALCLHRRTMFHVPHAGNLTAAQMIDRITRHCRPSS